MTRTVRDIHTVLRRSLTDALRWGRVERNVADSPIPHDRWPPATAAILPPNASPS